MSSQIMNAKKTIGQYDVDDWSRVYTADGCNVFAKIFGSGIAYP